MTLRQAQASINADIDLTFKEHSRKFVASALAGPEDDPIVAVASHKSDCLKRIVEYFYELFGQEALKRADYRCQRCGRFAGLQRHHKVHRARGQRDDSVENLEWLCAKCHGQEHGG